jgi:hypothetical protein
MKHEFQKMTILKKALWVRLVSPVGDGLPHSKKSKLLRVNAEQPYPLLIRINAFALVSPPSPLGGSCTIADDLQRLALYRDALKLVQ